MTIEEMSILLTHIELVASMIAWRAEASSSLIKDSYRSKAQRELEEAAKALVDNRKRASDYYIPNPEAQLKRPKSKPTTNY